MEPFITKIRTNLNGILPMTKVLDGIMVTGDERANKILVELYRDNTPFIIPQDSEILGYIIRSDGYTVELPGEFENEVASVTIPALAYEIPGQISIAIRLLLDPYTENQRGYYDSVTNYFVIENDPSKTKGPHNEPITTRTANLWRNKIVIATASCYVQIAETESIIDPGHYIPDVAEIIAKLAEIDAREAQFAEAEATRIANETTRQEQEQARQAAIQGMTVAATGLAYNSTPTATISDVSGHKHIVFGLVPGRPFAIKRSFASISAMESYTGSDVELYDFVIITSNVDDPDNAKLYMKVSNGWSFITDLSGAQGIQGPQGIQGVKGDTGSQGPRGYTGNGVASAVVNQDYSLTITYTDGTSYTSGSIRGATGPQGPQGEKGDKGDPGAGGASVSYNSSTKTVTVAFG